MPKAKTQTKSKNPNTNKGKKGGVGILTPETVGAMAGAAIGGVAGMMLGNRHTKGKLATVKQGATTAAKSALNVLESEALNVGSEVSGTKNKLTSGKSSGKNNSRKKK